MLETQRVVAHLPSVHGALGLIVPAKPEVMEVGLLKHLLCIYFFLSSVVSGIEFRTSCILGKYSYHQLYHQSLKIKYVRVGTVAQLAKNFPSCVKP